MAETTSSWWLDASGEWIRRRTDEAGHPLDDMQNRLMQQVGQRTRTAKRR
jgi:polyphosphate kinase